MVGFRTLVFGFAFALVALVGSQANAARPLSEKVTERVVDEAIDSGLEALAKPENQARLGAILSSAAVTRGVHDISFAVVGGVLDGMQGRVKLGLDTKNFWKGFDVAMRKHVAPAVGNVTRVAVDAAMDTALSEENGARLDALAAHATHGAIKGIARGIREDLAPALAYAIEHELAPAGAAALEHHLMPAFARGLSTPEMQLAIAMTMNSVASNLVRGGDEGIATAKAEGEADGKDGALKIFGDRLTLGANLALMVGLALGSVLILLAVLLIRSNRGQHKLAEQGKRREDELLAVVEQLETSDEMLDKSALRDLLRQHMHDSPPHAKQRIHR